MSTSIACIFYKNDKLFIAKRQNFGQMGGRWEFPGGKVEEGESFEQAIIREMHEEFNTEVTVIERIAQTEFMHNDKKCMLYAYAVAFEHDGMEIPFELTEHTEYKWVKPSEIKKLDFVDSDLKIYKPVVKYIKGLKKHEKN